MIDLVIELAISAYVASYTLEEEDEEYELDGSD